MSAVFYPYFFGMALLSCAAKRENVFVPYKKKRGMSIRHDWHDWLGGLPFEVASVEQVVERMNSKSFTLRRITTSNGGS